jgi:hypothetical protein
MTIWNEGMEKGISEEAEAWVEPYHLETAWPPQGLCVCVCVKQPQRKQQQDMYRLQVVHGAIQTQLGDQESFATG